MASAARVDGSDASLDHAEAEVDSALGAVDRGADVADEKMHRPDHRRGEERPERFDLLWE